jgi:hypothetical protein
MGAIEKPFSHDRALTVMCLDVLAWARRQRLGSGRGLDFVRRNRSIANTMRMARVDVG